MKNWCVNHMGNQLHLSNYKTLYGDTCNNGHQRDWVQMTWQLACRESIMIKNLFIDVNNSIIHDQGKVKTTAMSYYIKVDDKLESSFSLQSARHYTVGKVDHNAWLISVPYHKTISSITRNIQQHYPCMGCRSFADYPLSGYTNRLPVSICVQTCMGY